jgi:hypothetical protein
VAKLEIVHDAMSASIILIMVSLGARYIPNAVLAMTQDRVTKIWRLCIGVRISGAAVLDSHNSEALADRWSGVKSDGSMPQVHFGCGWRSTDDNDDDDDDDDDDGSLKRVIHNCMGKSGKFKKVEGWRYHSPLESPARAKPCVVGQTFVPHIRQSVRR